ncbi:cysteine hydrolase family protein [Parasphingopyxis marina]|uniref:Cysteine hydrolase n=1 Tax=Parasphingopyxis marina TaxID=2761622 RepID=A0A842I0B6_9SPHN|nr:cysteine hydrolase [Parasphingopyxis marina]MBC2778277.1 cysteine hydrolase [Parasphingopyxis marina]
MHKIELDPALVERLTVERGGRLHVFDDFDPARTAHLVIDLQNGFMEPGAPVEVPLAKAIVPNVNTISEAIRKAGGTNIFVRFTTPSETLDGWSSFYKRFPKEVRQAHQAAFAPGAHYWQLWDELDVRADDLAVDKQRFSAFIPDTCNLHEILQARGIDTLLITGTLTNCCCESTARDAMQLNYRIIFASDANATLTDAEHNATLNNMCALFCDVMSTEEILEALERKAPAAVAAE